MPDCVDLVEDSTEENREESSSALPQEKVVGGIISTALLGHYRLDAQDTGIIVQLFNRLMEGKDGIKATQILKTVSKDSNPFSELRRIIRLVNLGILTASHDDCNTPDVILRSTLELSGEFINAIYEGKETVGAMSEPLEPYDNNLQYLADQFERITLMENAQYPGGLIRRRSFKARRLYEPDSRDTIQRLEESIQQRLSLTQTTFPFEAFKRQKKLTAKEELIVLALLRREMLGGHTPDIEAVLNIISKSMYERLEDMKLFEPAGRLVKSGMVEFEEPGFFRRGRETVDIRLGSKLRRIFVGERAKRKDKASNGFFETTKPSISMDSVVLPQATHSDITLALDMIQGNAAVRLNEWGFRHNLQAATGRKRQPVIMLFYGPPGTGKTLAANAIAHELRRSVLSLDCSSVVDKYVGESQKNARMIFDRYREAAKKMKNMPILLLNEADQFLQKRMEATRSVDSMYNQMQNIFLEQMEQFEGILIATTNLADHLDPAFSRRFHYKIGFLKPGPEERIRLWRVHMPEKAPLSDDVDIESLAACYPFTGGQIAVAVRNAAARAAVRGDRLTQEDLTAACESELAGNFDEKQRPRIGFN